jgi:hypothetical protein
MIEIFKTNVHNKKQAKQVMISLQTGFAEAKINFDLTDCDKILRVEGIRELDAHDIINDLNRLGFECDILI